MIAFHFHFSNDIHASFTLLVFGFILLDFSLSHHIFLEVNRL